MTIYEIIRRRYLLDEITEEDIWRYHKMGILSAVETELILGLKRERGEHEGDAERSN